MRNDLFETARAPDPSAQPDLSAEIIQSVPKGRQERVTCVRVSGNNYRCNWWSPAPTKLYDNPKMRGLMVTTHVITKSRFINAVKINNQLVITDAAEN